MSYTMKCFRSGNTLRVSILAALRYKLHAQPGDVLRVEEGKHGRFELDNISHTARVRAQGRDK